VAVEAFVFGKL